MTENNHKNSTSAKATADRHDEPIVIGITMGEPLGIGPEIIVKALYDPFVRRGGRSLSFSGWMNFSNTRRTLRR